MKIFLRSFTYAFNGIKYCFLNERNFKLHFLAMLIVIVAGILTKISIGEWLIVIIFIAGVLALELINTAIERTVDLVTKDYHLLAKQAKDTAAGAVLVFSIASVIAALLIFLPKWLNL